MAYTLGTSEMNLLHMEVVIVGVSKIQIAVILWEHVIYETVKNRNFPFW